MKKFLFVALFVIAGTLACDAQLVTSRMSTKEKGNNLNSFNFIYSPTTFHANGAEDLKLNSLSLNFNQGVPFGPVTPMYFEWGLTFDTSFGTYASRGVSISDLLMSLRAPLGLMGKIQIPNTNFSIMPFGGFDAIIYLLGSETFSYSGHKETLSLFNASQLGVKLNRFNIDWHIGLKAAVNKFQFGFSYEGPILGLYSQNGSKINISQFNLFIGLLF